MDLVDKRPEVLAEHRLAPGEVEVSYAAPLERVEHLHELIPGRLALGGVRGGHEAMLATEIAFSGDAPLHRFFESSGIEDVALVRTQRLAMEHLLDEAAFLPAVIVGFFFRGQFLVIDIGLAIAR